MGGVAFIPEATTSSPSPIRPILWRAPFPPAVVSSLVSFANPTGTINNSELELAGTIAQHDIISQFADVREHTLHNGHDNTAAVFWQRKGSTTTTGPTAYLLRIQALHQRFHRYIPLHDYLPGTVNAMADDCSRLWHLSDSQLLAYFNSTYPQPVTWQLCHLRPEMSSALTLALLRKRSAPASFLAEPVQPITIGTAGWISAKTKAGTPGYTSLKTLSPSSKSLLPDTVMAALPPAATPSDLEQWRTRSVPWARRSPAWGPRTFAKTKLAASISASNGN
jgi:hypothetical protein